MNGNTENSIYKAPYFAIGYSQFYGIILTLLHQQ